MNSLVTYKTFGKDTKPTLYYLTGYDTHIQDYWLHIKLLNTLGFRIVAFEYNKAILATGNPDNLMGVQEDIKKFIQKDKQGRAIAGLYCISLGSWLGLNLLTLCSIEKAFFLTGGVSVLETVWNQKPLAKEKAAYVHQGFSKETLNKSWGVHDYSPEGKRFSDKKFVVFSSKSDEVLHYDEVSQNVTGWKKDNPHIDWIVYKHLSHKQTIIWGMFHVFRTISFFKQ